MIRRLFAGCYWQFPAAASPAAYLPDNSRDQRPLGRFDTSRLPARRRSLSGFSRKVVFAYLPKESYLLDGEGFSVPATRGRAAEAAVNRSNQARVVSGRAWLHSHRDTCWVPVDHPICSRCGGNSTPRAVSLQDFNNLSSWRWLVFCAYPMTETIRVGSTAAD